MRWGNGRYQLVMGERRWRASQRAGLSRIPAIVRRTGDDILLRDALLENIHRVQLNPLEEAAAYEQLLVEFGVTHAELADRLGRSRPVVTNTIRLLKLPVTVQRRVAAVLRPDTPARSSDWRTRGSRRISRRESSAEELSVRATEESVLLARSREEPTTPRPPRRVVADPVTHEVAKRSSHTFDTRVRVEVGQRKGRIVVEFGDAEDLARIAALWAARSAEPASVVTGPVFDTEHRPLLSGRCRRIMRNSGRADPDAQLRADVSRETAPKLEGRRLRI